MKPHTGKSSMSILRIGRDRNLNVVLQGNTLGNDNASIVCSVNNPISYVFCEFFPRCICKFFPRCVCKSFPRCVCKSFPRCVCMGHMKHGTSWHFSAVHRIAHWERCPRAFYNFFTDRSRLSIILCPEGTCNTFLFKITGSTLLEAPLSFLVCST